MITKFLYLRDVYSFQGGGTLKQIYINITQIELLAETENENETVLVMMNGSDYMIPKTIHEVWQDIEDAQQ